MSDFRTQVALWCAILLVSACSKQANDNAPGARDQSREALPAATYVGKDACVNCHAEESAAWRDSHHDLAMQHADEQSVLGDFNNSTFEKDGVSSRFFMRDGAPWVETDNANGELEEFRVSYTFGVTPLQQYLVEFADGRIQTLPIAWDVPQQRWFHVYPDESIPHTDILHWTGREQNWNYMCAECHSTNLRKNYTLAEDTFDTQWSEINVSCEACHGPASNHVSIAESAEWDRGIGLLVDLDDGADAVWTMDEQTGIAARMPSRMSPTMQPEACGRCHSRRGSATENYEFGRPLLDTHLVALLDDRLYFADGQIRDEVYVYGSFVQSKMYRAGVTCTDCHDPHSATLQTGGTVSQVCSSCHLPAKFATDSHHHHEPETVECVDCHMASRDYMVIDGRRDHSFRIPRPDLSTAIGVPNACNQCHANQSNEWAQSAATNWWGEADPGHFALAFDHARNSALGANDELMAVIADESEAGIVRATALTLLSPPLSREQVEVMQQALSNADPFMRLGALRALPVLPPEAHAPLASPLLNDPVRAVRLGAVEIVSPVRQSLDAPFRQNFELAEQEYIQAQLAIAERPESLANLANLFRSRGDVAQSENFYRHALAREPRLSSARANLADLYRATQRDDNAERVLRDGLALDANDATLHHVLGLLLVRSGRQEEALEELQKAAELQPDSSRYVYVYAVALNSLGQPEAALRTLQEASKRFPSDPDIAGMLQSLSAPAP